MSQSQNTVLDALQQSRLSLGLSDIDSKGPGRVHLGRLFTLILFGFIIITLLLAVLAGTRLYQSLNDMRTQTDNDRSSLALLINTVRANDRIDSVAVGQGPEGRSLVFVQRLDSGTYETRIYEYDGDIVQEYALASNAYTPARADVVAPSDVFDFGYENGLLTIYTQDGAATVDLRSVRVG